MPTDLMQHLEHAIELARQKVNVIKNGPKHGGYLRVISHLQEVLSDIKYIEQQ